MILSRILSSDAYTPVNKTIAKEFWFVTAGYFGELVRQRERFWQEEFYFSQDQMTEEIGISDHEQRVSLKKLVEIGFVVTKRRGMPSKYFFRIQDDQVLEFFKHKSSKIWSTSPSNFEAQVLENFEHKYKKENKKEKIRNNYIAIFDFWNTKKIVEHGKITTSIDTALKKALKDYTQEEIEKAITVYAEVFHSKKAQFSYKWTLDEFLNRKNALPVFLYKKLEDYIFCDTQKFDKVGEIKKTQEIVQKRAEEERSDEESQKRRKLEDAKVLRWFESLSDSRRKPIEEEIEKNPLVAALSPIKDEDSQEDRERKMSMLKKGRDMATLYIARKHYFADHEAMQE